MDRLLFAIALILGAIATVWTGSVFIDTNMLALIITAVIGCVYGIGTIELILFRHATSTLSTALSLPQEKMAEFDGWLDRLDGSIVNAVRLRIEGERVGLPSPVLTPYLVGLLVMLGLLGTFVGMVDTLRGAVIALEGTTELQAIRDGLAAPIQGLGLAFGTSVAGVATSAMLGLMSTLSRRHRILETRKLDNSIPTVFREFSMVHSQRETFRALQFQTRAIPEVAGKLDSLANKLSQIGDSLLTNQEAFHASIRRNYCELAESLNQAHKENLAESVRLAGEMVKPVVKEAMTGMTQETRHVFNTLTRTTEKNIATLSKTFATQSEEITESCRVALASHHSLNEALITHLGSSLDGFSLQFARMGESMLDALNQNAASWTERQEEINSRRLEQWTDTLGNAQKQAVSHVSEASKTFARELKQVADIQHESFELTLAQQKEMSDSLKASVGELTTGTQRAATRIQDQTNRLLKSSGDLIQSRIESEAALLDGHKKRMDVLTETLTDELGRLRDDEQRRGQAAVSRLEKLESVLVSHVATIGKSLEDPIARLVQTVSEVPRSALQVISQMRQEVSNSLERDNDLLEKHQHVIEELDKLSTSLVRSSSEQREAIAGLVNASKTMLEDVGHRFAERVATEVTSLSDVSETFAGSAVEMASLGDAFGTAVNLFNESNENLIEKLARIEESLDKSGARSDEQLAYYVAQAREIIDHCMLSQKEIVEDIRQLRPENHMVLEAD